MNINTPRRAFYTWLFEKSYRYYALQASLAIVTSAACVLAAWYIAHITTPR